MKRNSRGFTLLELMVAVTILAILLGWGVPTFREFTRNNTVITAQNDLVTSLSLARSEALRRNQPVTVCASPDAENCGDEADWPIGWIAFIDRDVPGVVDDDDELVQSWQPANSDLVITAGGDAFVQYLPTGMAAGAITIDISWEGCTGGDRKRRVAVIATGSVSGEKISCES
jgi:type IV fimbrial biogenesis protein FimT